MFYRKVVNGRFIKLATAKSVAKPIKKQKRALSSPTNSKPIVVKPTVYIPMRRQKI